MKAWPAFDVICAEFARQLQDGEVSMDASGAFDLLCTARWQLDNMKPATSIRAHGPLYETVMAARAQVYEPLMRRWHARREVLDAGRARWFAGQRDVRALLVDLLNVLLAADAAVGAERAYARAERRAMAAAVVADIRGDELGIASQRDVVQRAAADALHMLASTVAPYGDGDWFPPFDLIRNEVERRLRGEVQTDAYAACELVAAVRDLVDNEQPVNYVAYGPLFHDVMVAREPVCRRLVRLRQARREVTNRNVRDVRARLVDLNGVLLEVGTVVGVEQAYVRAEWRAMAAAVVAKVRDDKLGVAQQRDAVYRAAADALDALQTLDA
ncbi:hypothetical protein [Mycobacterium lacus]|uniref:Uncharacterized protein n=1 Tax=Mycobacterium lacus TaxID=169765 RepID=A0A1X1XJW9_9MYCO|nr:hypothetical protein [Mycobacterium lacus]MCV7123351.1 hypothetical protein [Mycobacterium lacus]ORV99165.1 hypothetical protein AWC15_10925 [Mycobacterium lacus]BBX99012.1 hypothetical protein MLAC_43060 [Mycobacterium lacus]